MFLALILMAVVSLLLCWLLFSLASLALPLFVGVIAGHAAHAAGAGFVGALLTGIAAGAGTLFCGQLLFATLHGTMSRTALVMLFAAPAAAAGYSAGHGVAAIAGVSTLAQIVFGAIAATCVTAAAIARLTVAVPSLPSDRAETLSMSDPILPSTQR